MAKTLQPPGEVRALPMLNDLPAGCIVHPVTDEKSAPHLRPGEFAIVDTTDREPDLGEVFVMKRRDGFAIVRPRLCPWCTIRMDRQDESEPAWDLVNLKPPRGGGELVMANGFYGRAWLASQFVGRVVGIYAPTFDLAGS
jgi:hypothetical protein